MVEKGVPPFQRGQSADIGYKKLFFSHCQWNRSE